MADCTFDIEYSGDAQALIQRAELVFKSAGGNFAGNTDRGNFAVLTPLGSVSGRYEIEPHHITIFILRKPFLMPCATIERYIRSYLADHT